MKQICEDGYAGLNEPIVYSNRVWNIQLALTEEDIETLRIASEWSDDPDLVRICKRIIGVAK